MSFIRLLLELFRKSLLICLAGLAIAVLYDLIRGSLRPESILLYALYFLAAFGLFYLLVINSLLFSFLFSRRLPRVHDSLSAVLSLLLWYVIVALVSITKISSLLHTARELSFVAVFAGFLIGSIWLRIISFERKRG